MYGAIGYRLPTVVLLFFKYYILAAIAMLVNMLVVVLDRRQTVSLDGAVGKHGPVWLVIKDDTALPAYCL